MTNRVEGSGVQRLLEVLEDRFRDPGSKSDCVGCGYCCIKVPCTRSLATFGKLDCPALVWNGERYRCAMAEEWGAELYMGEGCCAALNTWRLDVRNRDRCRTERGWP